MHAAGCRRARSRCRTGADSRITAVCGPPRRIAGRISKRRLAGQTARPAAESVPAAAVCRRDGRILRRFRIKKAADRASSVCRKQECYLKVGVVNQKTLGCAVPALSVDFPRSRHRPEGRRRSSGKGDCYLLLISTVTSFVNFTGANSLSSAYL